MSLLTKASLVMTPNAIKESKVYSIIPSSGNGDLTFTRGTNASGTLNNDNLLIENAPYNLISNSNVFTGAYYNKSLVAVTSNTIASITGAVNASTLTEVAGTNSHHIHENTGSFTPVVGTSYTMSCYLKQPTSSANRYVQLPFFIAGFGSNAYVNFDLQTLTKGTIGASITSSDISIISNGWIRITATAVATATGASGFQLSLIPASTSTRTESYTVTAGSENSVYIYGFQVVFGTVAKDYFNTTDRLNVPRLNYDTVGGCPSLLLEPQRTNLFTYSNDFTNVIWSKVFMTVATSSAQSPFTNTNATLLTATAAFSSLTQLSTVGVGTYTTSYFVKYINQQFITLVQQGTPQAIVTFDLINGTVSSSSGTSGFYVGNSIKSVGNGWYRISLTVNVTTAGFSLGNALWFGAFNGNNNSGSQVYVFGAQTELGAYPTSYIPTIASTITRNADVSNKTGISDLIGQTEGVMFIESAALFNDLTQRTIAISDGTANNRIFLFYSTTSSVISVFGTASGTSFPVGVSYTMVDVTQFAKIAVRYRANDISLWVNGVKRGTDITSQALPINFSRFGFDSGSGGSVMYAKVKQVHLYKTYLTDTEMAALTT